MQKNSVIRETAKRIVEKLNPKAVLDAACGDGQLVAALRELGVEAYGVDSSVSLVTEEARPYCFVGALADCFPEEIPQQYDLIVCGAFPAYFKDRDIRIAIGYLCEHTDRVLYGLEDGSGYEAETFAKQGLGESEAFERLFFAPFAVCYGRGEGCCAKSILPGNRSFGTVVKDIAMKIYKVLKRVILRTRIGLLFAKGLKSLLKDGFRVTWRRVRYKIMQMLTVPRLRKNLYTKKELAQQRKTTFPREILFSILVPLYNTPEKYLREMIASVQAQTYSNWELCLADGSDDAHADVGRIVKELAQKDSRIRYEKLERNLGISGNTNACIDMARGNYISLFDHDDLLHPAALYDTAKVICEQNADFVYTDENTFHKTPKDAFCPHFKPDYAPDTLRANNYICHFTTFKASLLDAVGKFRPECDGSQDFDMVLRLTEKAEKVVHIPKILYYWRAHPNSVASSIGAKPYVIEAAKKAISDHLDRIGLKGEVLDTVVPSMYRLCYDIEGEPLVSILIPNYEHKADLKKCLDSIFEKTSYRNFEIIIIENNSKCREIFDYYEEIQLQWPNVKVVTWNSYFNYSAINNFGARFASGSHLLLLNNDVEVISPDWIQEMLMYSQRADVGAVGAKLYYPDDTVQHAGLGIGVLTIAGHLHRGFDRKHPGYMGRLIYAQNLSGVTAACAMIRREVWDQIGGLDETFEVAFNDVDMCLRIRKAGYLIVWTPFAELYHYESKSRGSDQVPKAKNRFLGEVRRFLYRWEKELEAGDPYYNPNFSREKEDFTIRF